MPTTPKHNMSCFRRTVFDLYTLIFSANQSVAPLVPEHGLTCTLFVHNPQFPNTDQECNVASPPHQSPRRPTIGKSFGTMPARTCTHITRLNQWVSSFKPPCPDATVRRIRLRFPNGVLTISLLSPKKEHPTAEDWVLVCPAHFSFVLPAMGIYVPSERKVIGTQVDYSIDYRFVNI